MNLVVLNFVAAILCGAALAQNDSSTKNVTFSTVSPTPSTDVVSLIAEFLERSIKNDEEHAAEIARIDAKYEEVTGELKQKDRDLNAKHNTLKNKHKDLSKSVSSTDYALSIQYEKWLELQQKHGDLKAAHDALKIKHNTLSATVSALQDGMQTCVAGMQMDNSDSINNTAKEMKVIFSKPFRKVPQVAVSSAGSWLHTSIPYAAAFYYDKVTPTKTGFTLKYRLLMPRNRRFVWSTISFMACGVY